MDSRSQETLRRVEENDDTLVALRIGNDYRIGFNSTDGYDFSRLGTCIGENTHLTTLAVVLPDAVALSVTNNEFYDGLKQNSSIHKLTLICWDNIAGGVGQKILEAYQENNSNITDINISRMGFENGGEHIIAQTLRRCTNLTHISLTWCNNIINDDQTWSNINEGQLLPIVEALREHRSLEKLHLCYDRIGNAGCGAIATLLSDPISNLHTLYLSNNLIDNEGAATLANGLANNTKLKELYLDGNLMDNQSGVDIFSEVLCNTSSINNTFLSNHTLEKLHPFQGLGRKLTSLPYLNKCNNKSHVAIKKILTYHPNIDMEPFFEWNMEGEGERDLKALPYVIAWFDRAAEAVADEGGDSYNIDERKLSTIYQFAGAMPLMFVPVAHNKGGDNKRKRGDK